jgi:hypothetical protein
MQKQTKQFDINEYVGTIACAVRLTLTSTLGSEPSTTTILKFARMLDSANLDYDRVPKFKTEKEREMFTCLRTLAPDGRIGYNTLLYLLPESEARCYFEYHPQLRVHLAEGGVDVASGYLSHSGAVLIAGGWGVESSAPHREVGIPVAEFLKQRKAKLNAKKPSARATSATNSARKLA